MKRKITIIALTACLIFPNQGLAVMRSGQTKKIVSEYRKLLDDRRYSVGKESDLPFSKDVIRKALVSEFIELKSKSLIREIENAYLELETFISDREFEIIRRYEESVLDKKKMRKNRPVITKVLPEYSEIQRKILDRQKARLKELGRLRRDSRDVLETYVLPGIECNFDIPEGFKKADAQTHKMVEAMRISVCPEEMTQEEKRKSAKLEVVFFRELNELKLPFRPFFTVRNRVIKRPITEHDFESQIAIFETMAKDGGNSSEKSQAVTMTDHIIKEIPIINYKSHSIIMSRHETSSYGNAEGYYLIQSFFYYKNGLLTLSFYSDRDSLENDIHYFKTIVYSMEFGKNTRW
jgi:hypothetical protein